MMSSRFSQWEDLSVSIILMSHDLSQQIIIGYLGEIQQTYIIQRDERQYEARHSVGVWSLKIPFKGGRGINNLRINIGQTKMWKLL